MDLGIAIWTKATRSNDSGDACIEVGTNSEVVAIRDSKDPDGPKISISHRNFRVLTNIVKNL